MAVIKVTPYAMLDSENRCDAEHIAAPILIAKNYHYGCDVIDCIQYGTSKQLNEHGKGYSVLRLNEFEQMFIKSPEKHCSLITEGIYQQLRLKKGDVLVCRTNGNPRLVGKTAVVMEDTECAYASYVFKVRPNKLISPQVLTVYLNSRYGRSEIERHQMISIQTNFSPERFKKCRIPHFSEIFQEVINKLVDQAYSNLKNSKSLYIDTEKYLLDVLGMGDFVLSTNKFSIRGLADSFYLSNRIDAQYYLQKHEEILAQIGKHKHKKLGQYVNNYSTGFAYSSKDYIEDGAYALIRINNIVDSQLDISNAAMLSKNTALQSKKDIINIGDVLVSMSGTIGDSCCVTDDVTAVVNQRILRITPKDIDGNMLSLILNSIIGKIQFERIGTGGVQTNISYFDMRKIIIPILDSNVQSQITANIQHIYVLRRQSKQLLEAAKRAVEIAIEDSEDAVMAWLSEQHKEGVK
ncbi:MAG: restriction endonuclease subunit S [Oscillospiraceae bacterium]|jgi:type I restriction enzyme S subunit|nr:restriction endonuclease subunit S [Oscillospiraceae bacterium]